MSDDMTNRVDSLALRLKALRPPPSYWTPPPLANALTCSWDGCGEPPRATSKYCSRACSNKNAHWRHAQRKKGLL